MKEIVAEPFRDKMTVLCGQSRTLQIVDGTQTSLPQPSSFMTHKASRFRLAQTRTDLSLDPETTRLPSGENAGEVTESVCPYSTLICSPVFPSHSRTDLSQEPETIR